MSNIFIKVFLIIILSLTIIVESAINDTRFVHSSAIVNDKLYIIGGLIDERVSNDLFYLDLTKSFDALGPPWIDLTSTKGMELAWASATALGDKILLFGGISPTSVDNPLYLFDTSIQQWTLPKTRGEPPVSRVGVNIVSDEIKSKIYIYGGVEATTTGSPSQWFADMIILNTLEFSWELAQMENAPTFPRAGYTATMLPTGLIVFIGGRIQVEENGQVANSEVKITDVTLFDTNEAKWYLMVTDGAIDDRHSHSAVLTSDGKIIIYGGAKGIPYITASPDVAVLDTNSQIFKWSTPQTTSTIRPPPLMLHTANLYRNYMFVAFGNITNGMTSPTNESTTTPPSEKLSLGFILGIVSAGIVFAVIIVIISVLLYKRHRRSEIIATPGSSNIFVERDDDARTSVSTGIRNSTSNGSVIDSSSTTFPRPLSLSPSPTPTPLTPYNPYLSNPYPYTYYNFNGPYYTPNAPSYVPYNGAGVVDPNNPHV